MTQEPSRSWSWPGGRARRYRAGRWLRLAAVALLAWFIAGVAVAVWVPHGGLLAAFLLMAGVPALAVVTLAAVLALLLRWAWRSTAWLEIIPLAAGAPWLGRLLWAARAVLAGRAAWRAGRRLRRPLRQRRAGQELSRVPAA